MVPRSPREAMPNLSFISVILKGRPPFPPRARAEASPSGAFSALLAFEFSQGRENPEDHFSALLGARLSKVAELLACCGRPQPDVRRWCEGCPAGLGLFLF